MAGMADRNSAEHIRPSIPPLPPVPPRHTKVNGPTAIVDKPVDILWMIGARPVEGTRCSRERKRNIMPSVIRRRFVPPMARSLTPSRGRLCATVGIHQFS
jgi:hypothetical protein